MKHNLTPTNVLTSRLTRQVNRTLLTLFVILSVILLIFLIPVMYRTSADRTRDLTGYIADQFNDTLYKISSEMTACAMEDDFLSSLHALDNDLSDQNSARMRLQLQDIVSGNSSVIFAILELEEGNILSAFSDQRKDLIDIYLSDPNLQSRREKNQYLYFSAFFNYYDKNYADSKRYGVFASYGFTDSRGKKAILTCYYDISPCIRNSKAIAGDSISDYQIVTFDKNLCYDSLETTSEEAIAHMPQLIYSTAKSLRTVNGLYQRAPISSTGWLCLTHTSWYCLFSSLFPILLMLAGFCILIPILFTVIIPPINNRFLRPLTTLTTALNSYNAGDELTLDIHTDDELEQLSHATMNMSRKISAQIEDIRQHERRQSLTQYSLLATQVDPHFIYNTLNVINIMAQQQGQEDIVKINTALTKILRERFSVKSAIFETIENELDTISQYYTIMQYRYKNEVCLNVSAETELLQDKIPKNLLIPILENSYYHGLSTEIGLIKGNIELTIYDMDDMINIEISDDGNGIPAEKLAYLKSHLFKTPDSDRTHIGLSNVYERLRHIYQERFQFDIISTEGYGATISIAVPKYQSSFEDAFFK